MGRELNKNMIIMLVSIMVGVILVTYFAADIKRQQENIEQEKHISSLASEIESKENEIVDVKAKNVNFTNHFLKSSGILDTARENRANGNYNFDVSFLFYTTALSEKNESKLNFYKANSLDKSEKAMLNYTWSYNNFLLSKDYFEETKNFTDYESYLSLLDLYIQLSESGARLTKLRYNASLYLSYLVSNLTYVNESVTYVSNVSEVQNLFNQTEMAYLLELNEVYNELQDEIKEYDIEGFSPIR